MKRIITLIAIGVALISFAPQAQAQTKKAVNQKEVKVNKQEIMKEAKMEVSKLTRQLELSDAQQEVAIEKYYSYKLNYKKHLGENNTKDRVYLNNKKKFDQSLVSEMKKVLNEDQYKAYEAMMKEKIK
jgi:hypothetical protein